MSPNDLLTYAPEHHPTIELPVVAVPADRWISTGEPIPPRLPMHPWQFAHVRDDFPWLVPTGRTITARPLMSLRTVAPVGDPGIHLKTAINVQMTSAVRTVSPAALHNGPAVSALLATLAARTVGIEILRERSGGAVLVDGEPLRSLAYVRRVIPTPAPGEIAMPMAALAAPSPRDGRPMVCEAIELGYSSGSVAGAEDFFRDMIELLLPAALSFLRDGVALEAHGQNTLIVLRDGRPIRFLYRDIGGVRVSAKRLNRAGLEAPDLRGDIASDDAEELRTKLFASLLSTVVAELVAVLTREYDVAPERLWDHVARVARTFFGRSEDDRVDAAAFFADRLPVKAMVAMRLADEPLDDIWAMLPNPMCR